MQGGAPGELRPDLSCERFTLFVRELGVHKLSGVHNVRGHLLGHRLHKCGEHHIWNRGGGACASKLLEAAQMLLLLLLLLLYCRQKRQRH